jgi:hypothetical protein
MERRTEWERQEGVTWMTGKRGGRHTLRNGLGTRFISTTWRDGRTNIDVDSGTRSLIRSSRRVRLDPNQRVESSTLQHAPQPLISANPRKVQTLN